ncbi:MAG: DHH family phosphoesterase [Clostridia bacterium]|nr:DHH family phosphoesterase [Clostridia bacterium]
MKFKNVVRNFPVFVVAMVAALVCIVATAASGEYKLAAAEACLLVGVILLTVAYYSVYRKKKQEMLESISQEISFADGRRNSDFPIPVMVSDEKGKFLWYNKAFEDVVLDENEYSEIEDIIEDGINVLTPSETRGVNIKCDGKYFTVYSHRRDQQIVFYFIDNTKLRLVADEFVKTRPAVLMVSIDGVDELQRLYKESDCSSIRNGVTRLIEQWLSEYDCMMTKKGDSTFIIVTKTSDVDRMIEQKFDILDAVRNYQYNSEDLSITLSIGVGTEGGVGKCQAEAKAALEMAFDRGGDQAVVKNKDNYEFFGGVSRSVERQTTVKTRIIANDFAKLIESCNRVIVMGHKYPDLDALGSAMGVVAVARAYGKEAFLATNSYTAASKPLIDYLKSNGFEDYIIPHSKAKTLLRKSTLLVVTDTHIKSFVECPELLEKASKIVVVDHHRKSVDFIDNAEIFYHDPSASSAGELVTQLIEYLPFKIKIGSVVADALLSGIMLDTKNFVLRTGAKTFETAAYLKKAGADTVRVKQLFADSITAYKAKSEIISSAETYKGCAVAVCKSNTNEVRVVSSQAADELLNIKDIKASFVIFKTDNVVNVSARSLGGVNVQIIMESLGGGGHQTMAAAQFENETTQSVSQKVKEAVDKYMN